MANYPEKNIVTDSGVVTPYLAAYGTARIERFSKITEDYLYAAPAAAPVAAPVYDYAAPKKACGYAKCPAIITIVLILALLVVAFAAISYIGIEAIKDYTTVYGAGTVETMVTDAINLFKDGGTAVLDYIVPIAFLASIVVAFCIFISAIAGLASKNRILFWVAALVMVLLTIASAVCYYISLDKVGFVDFLTPGGDYLQIGFFVVLGLQLITLIVSCFANKKICK